VTNRIKSQIHVICFCGTFVTSAALDHLNSSPGKVGSGTNLDAQEAKSSPDALGRSAV
jgi:hypothetical protein